MQFISQFNHKPHSKLISTMATFNSQLQLCNCTKPTVHSISAVTSITAAAQAAPSHSSNQASPTTTSTAQIKATLMADFNTQTMASSQPASFSLKPPTTAIKPHLTIP
ncbi:hypothetical protein M0R45_024945 [Rubus argutus]|uniref:Uncharacterized protein n=1 Tax=Rubus argutus TaxID=59490 RepID=A0AAW1WVT4_RUBAR